MDRITETDDFARVFSKKLRHFINVKNKTQEQVADALGVSGATVSYWCKGERVPRMDKIDGLCKLFGCTRDELMTDKTEPIQYDYAIDEVAIIEWYRKAPEHDRDFLRRMMAYSKQ